MSRTNNRAPMAAACALALAASLAAPAVPWAYASSSAYGADIDDILYVDEDDDGYDDNTDEWIGFGTAAAAAKASSEKSQGSGTAGSTAATGSGSSENTGSNGSSSVGASDSKTADGNNGNSSSASSAKGENGSSASAGEADKKDVKSDDGKDQEKPTNSAFTFAGTGTTVDNATSGDGVEFFTIKTDDDKVYYLVVDRNSGTDNVYLLNTVTGNDLEALAENGKINLGTPAIAAPAEEKKTDAEEKQPQQQGVPEWLAYLVVVAVVGGGAFAYYQLKVKPEREESKVDEREIRTFEDDGIYPSPDFEQYGNWGN